MLLGAISQKFDTIVEFTAFEDFVSYERKDKSMTTTLNKKGDNFYHSVFVSSNLFEDFYTNDTIEEQIPISDYSKESKEFKQPKTDIDKIFKKKDRSSRVSKRIITTSKIGGYDSFTSKTTF